MRLTSTALMLALAGVVASAARAEAPSRFTGRVWTVADGLPVNHVGGIAGTADGYLWFGTNDGVVRFDGVRMRVFDAGNTDALVNNLLPQVGVDAAGRLWAWGAAPWLSVFDSSGVRTYGTESGIPRTGLRGPRFGADGSVWLPMARGLYVLKGDRFVPAHPDLAELNIPSIRLTAAGEVLIFPLDGGARLLSRDRVTSLGVAGRVVDACETKDGSVWMATSDAVYRRTASGELTRVAETPRAELTAIGAGADGIVWLGAGSGLYRRDGGGFARVSPAPVTLLRVGVAGAVWSASGSAVLRDGLEVYRAPGEVLAIEADREGNVWIGTDAGVLRLQETTLRSLATGRSPWGVAAGPDGRIWIATDKGVSPADGRPEAIAIPGGASSLAFDRAGTMWVAGDRLYRVSAGRLEVVAGGGVDVLDVAQSSDGAIWSMRQGELRRFRDGAWASFGPANGTSAGPMQFGAESPDGTLWFTSPEGLLRFRRDRFDLVTEADGLSSNRTRAVYVDGRGVAWVGTEGRGVNRVAQGPGEDGRPYAITVFRERNGLHENGVFALAADSSGRLWLGTNRGIGWIAREEMDAIAAGEPGRVHMTVLEEKDGLASASVPTSGGALVAQSRGVLYFATTDGVARIDPAALRPDAAPPRSIVEAVVVQQEARPARGSVRLGPDEREFELAFTAPTFTDPDNVSFRYRLAGFQDEWEETGTRRVAYFTNVPPGRYRFEVQAANHSGTWSAVPAALDIVVAPAWHESAWFRWLVALMAIGLLFAAYRWRLRQAAERERILAAQVHERTRQLETEKEATESARHAEAQERQRAEAQRAIAEQAMETAQRQADRLWEMDQAKSRFFANVSHEFRTPLTLTIGPIEDVLSGMHGEVTEEARRELDTAVRSSRSVLDLVNQILELARLEAGQLQLHAGSLDLADLLRSVAAEFAPLAQRRGIRFTSDIGARPLPVRGDPGHLRRVVANLLSNAFKFTENGGSVGLNTKRVGEDSVEITVEDSGIGIAPEELDRVFDRFYQAHGGQQSVQPGTGIGLSLARELVELHGGRIEVESEKGSGSLFRVVLPLERGEAAAPAAPTAAAEAGEGASAPSHGTAAIAPPAASPGADGHELPLVLLVEDHEEVRALVRKHLAPRYRILEAADGEEALAIARGETPDLIVSDVMMPKLDGFGLLRALRADPELDFVPVILLTARDAVEDRVTAFGIGAEDYLAKPFHSAELVARVDGVIRTRMRLRERYLPAAGAERPPLRSADEAYLVSVTRIIDDHLADESFNLARLAHLLGQGRSQMFERIRETSGVAPAELLKRRRLERAAEMLKARAGTVGEIAYAVGFKSVSHFSRAFRELHGRTPSEWGRP